MGTKRMGLMALAAAMLAVPALGQNGTPGCGDEKITFKVKKVSGPHTISPESGKAVVYLIEDDTRFETTPKPTTRAGLDGQWIGATHGNSFFAVQVEPGEHHLCAATQKVGSPYASLLGANLAYSMRAEALSFTATAGEVYYFLVENLYNSTLQERPRTKLTALDKDQGQLMANRFNLSAASPNGPLSTQIIRKH